MKKDGVKPNKMNPTKKKAVSIFPATVICLAVAARLGAQTAQPVPLVYRDSVTAIASLQYSDPSFLRKWLMGNNYRKEWETPVRLPVLHLAAMGLQVKELGGGKQTKSLQLLDENNTEWALRSVDKDVRPAIPKPIRNKYTVSLVQDMVSAANPYAPLTIPPMAQAEGILAADPSFYFVPDDTALGKYREIFANTVCLLEKRDLLPDSKTKGTVKMLEDILDNHKAFLNQPAFLKARLLDMLVGDWDRHYDQWKWAESESDGKTSYRSIPKDRDQAYFFSNGWLLKFIRLFGMKFSVGFTDQTAKLVQLNSVARSLDELLLNALDRWEWQQTAQQFTATLPDDVIREAVKKLPPSIYSLHGRTITRKLLNRKRTLANDAMKYYVSLAKKLTVYGTDKAERFYLTGNSDSVTLTISNIKTAAEIYYRRTFYAAETKKVTLLGLDGDDMFACEEGLQTPIKFAIDGGKGQNDYQFSGKLKVKTTDSEMDAKAYLKSLRKPLRVRE